MDKYNTANEPGAFNLEKCLKLLNDPEITKIAEEFDKNKKAEIKLGFNLFRLISDTYYKENLHSAILAAFLNKDEQHNLGDFFLKKFLVLLRSKDAKLKIKEHSDVQLKFQEYSDAHVFCEKGRIDIQIRDNTSGKVIIIENKMNNAVDQPNQLINYFKQIEQISFNKEGAKYKVDRIVYLTLNQPKYPNMSKWELKDENERKKIKDLLILMVAYNTDQKPTLFDWIHNCKKRIEKEIEKLDKNGDKKVENYVHSKFVLMQYEELVKQLAGENMNTELMDEFYEKMKDEHNFLIATSLKDMLEKLTIHRAHRLFKEFEGQSDHMPFEGIVKWKPTIVVFEGKKYSDFRFKIYIRVEDKCYKFQVELVRQDSAVGMLIKTLSKTLELERDFFEYKTDYMMQRIFDFKQEKELITYFNEFKQKLGGLK
jgi:hypothetical protein